MTQDIKRALVTGGAKGIGRGIVARLVKEGWQVAAMDRDAAALADLPTGARGIEADVSDEAQVAAAIAATGWDGLDLLVNNAGLASPEVGPIEELDLATWNAFIGTNLTGALLMAKHGVPLLRARRGAIVNITSSRAVQSEPQTEPYAAAKGGLTALTHALAVSLGPEIRVNAIAPGWIVTTGWDELREIDHAQHPAGRAGRPEDVAEAVLWLAQAGFMTGESILLDGGMTRKMIYAE
ncbi:SDR family oxidoreductase [Limimaricola hongkongensis]|uniref:Oxidoreductase, short chain dehydrogenase/reductase family n=1 Tax=Limimaricola hongkongensis DSM 17492 TaxID=1122180 RepID=A0A017HCS7_9RHOB|nr:SDR family oxidoreductase [Limimaricola hongkongensis]EYD72181.1 Oxidoreductase, short chain dehydrogenase/reductase family [Limimaricola hongkongensis DSM 17492]